MRGLFGGRLRGGLLLGCYGLAGLAEANAHVRGVVAHLTILNEQQLRRLVLDAKLAGNLPRERAVAQQIEVVDGSGGGQRSLGLLALDLGLGGCADGAGGAVLENEHRVLVRLLHDGAQLLGFGERNPGGSHT
jgi:hypothetical protein